MKRKRASVLLSVIAPTYNERECIAAFVEEATRKLAALGHRYELVCVDDGSNDGTREILTALTAELACVRVVALERHGGKCAALEAGIAAARGELIGTIDVDLQNDAQDFGLMLEALVKAPGLACVVGWRTTRHDNVLRKVSSKIANWMSGLITGDITHDAACGLKLAPARLWRALPMWEGMHRFVGPLARAQGATIIEVPVSHRPRYAGRSKYGSGLGRALRALVDAVGVRWMAGRKRTVPAVELTERSAAAATSLSQPCA